MRLSSRIIYWILRRCLGRRSLGNQVPEYAIPTMMISSAVIAGAIVLNPNIIQWMSQSTHGTIDHDILSIQSLSTQIAPDSGLGVSPQTIARFSAPNTAYTSCFDANTCVQIPNISPTTAGSMGGRAISQLQALTQMLTNIRDLLATELDSDNPLLAELNQAVLNSRSLGEYYSNNLSGYAETRIALGNVGF
ncbi:MAG: hypothetical protein K2X01_02280 [Cyanobacteria bacterium]|nr:hypothetical protein [Cyanobacteriota bacterium]